MTGRRGRPLAVALLVLAAGGAVAVLLTRGGGSGTIAGPAPAPDAGTAAQAAGPPFFADVTAASGVAMTYRNGEEVQPPTLSILESLGGGVAAFDYEGTG